MKIAHLISASLLAGAVLSSSACAQPAPPTSDTAPISASSEPVVEEFVASQSDIEAVSSTMNGYYGFIARSDSRQKIQDATAVFREEGGSDYQKFVADFPEGFQYFDTSTDDAVNNAYKAMMLGSSASVDRPGMEITAPTEGVTVIDETTATFNSSWIELVEDGKAYAVDPEENPDPSDLVNLTKNDDGSWVIVAKPSSAKVSAP